MLDNLSGMLSRLAILAASAVLARAQLVPDIARLSATANGEALYAATNLTLRGEPLDASRKLVKWDVDRWITALGGGQDRQYVGIQEDASGRVQIYTALVDCGYGPSIFCPSGEAGAVYWRNRDTGVTWHIGYGRGSVSDNGEWAMTATDFPVPGSGPELRRIRLLDGRTDIAVEYTRLEHHPMRRTIADDGTIAVAAGGFLLHWPNGGPLRRASIDRFEGYVIDPRAEFLLGVCGAVRAGGAGVLWDTLCRLDLATGTITALFQTPLGVAEPDLASDRRTAVFLSAADWHGTNAQHATQIWLTDLESGTLRQLTSESANVKEVALAANGSAAFAVTGNLRVLRIDLAAVRAAEIAPEYPRILAMDPLASAWAPGGRYWLWGAGFGDAEIVAGDRSADVTAESPFDVEFLVPDDAPLAPNTARLGANRSPFQPQAIAISTLAVAPAFLGSGGRGTTWLHQDGVSPVTAANPARLGETVTARMTGLGPVDAAGNTVAGLEWSLLERTFAGRGGVVFLRTPVSVLGSRAVGQPGEYAVTVRLPDTLRLGIDQYAVVEARVAAAAVVSPMPLAP